MISVTNIDPRTKLIIVLLFSTLALIYNSLHMLFIIFVISVFVSFAMKSNLISIFVRIKKLLGVMAAIAFVQSFFNKAGYPLLRFGEIVLLTDVGIIKSFEFILRLAIIIVSASIITTSSSREIIQGLVQWKCPYEIAFMVSIAIRFLPIFKEELTDMVIAIQLRGVDLKKVKMNQKIKIYRYILIPIVINSILKAKELSAAMEMRGFRAYTQRTSYMVLKMNKSDYVIIGYCIFAVLLIIFI